MGADERGAIWRWRQDALHGGAGTHYAAEPEVRLYEGETVARSR